MSKSPSKKNLDSQLSLEPEDAENSGAHDQRTHPSGFSIQAIRTPREQKNLLSEFDPSVSSWIVSDLKSKLDLNRSLLRDREFISGETVLRASELWKLLLVRVRPDLQLISREFALTLIAQRLATLGHMDQSGEIAQSGEPSEDLSWMRSPGAAQTVYDYMSQLMPILSHPNGSEMLEEWFLENEASQVRWSRWHSLSQSLWIFFLDAGFIAPPWVPGVLVNELDLSSAWTRPLIVDLGAELTQVEADLLVLLSAHVDITVLRPEPSFASEYARTLTAYEIFEKKLKVNHLPPLPLRTFAEAGADMMSQASAKLGSKTFLKLTTMIAEVKEATSRTRKWLDAGVNATSISIAAPDIEAYWPALSSYLYAEGIACQKDHVRRLHTYPDITRWLAHLRLRTGSFAESDVELGLFDSLGRTPRLISFEKFRVLFAMIYGREDLTRVQEVADRFQSEVSLFEMVDRDQFVTWSLQQLPDDVSDKQVEALFKRVFAECPQSMSLNMKRWLEYLEQVASRVECRVKDGLAHGISVINLSSAENSPSTKMILLGLTESGLRKSGSTAVLASDVNGLAYELGFHLASEDQAKLEFEARWVAEDEGRELVLCVPETDFAGGVQAASWFWIKGAKESGELGEIALPGITRWDEVQRAPISQIAQLRKWSPRHQAEIAQALEEDLGEKALSSFGAEHVLRLSPSSIEDYLECPFIFAAKNLFKLADQAELDLEVDPSRRGSLMHKLLELLTAEPIQLQPTDEELDAVIDQAKFESKVDFADPRLWPPMRAKFKDLARRYLLFEKENRMLFPETKTIGFETEVKGYLNPKTGELRATGEPGDLQFKGRIDRIDQDQQGRVVIMDYKSSKGSVSQFGSWLKNNKIQLLLYSMAVENGLTELSARPVVSALYYVTRPLSRDNGFKVEDTEQSLFDVDKKKNRMSMAQKDQLFMDGRELIQKAVSEMLQGHFAPNPRDPKKCLECRWSALCRAPHLNT